MTQSEALKILQTGANVFLTGEPGSGKTFVVNEYVKWLEAAGVSAAVTASTGIAATHLGGMTIHAWSSLGTRDTLSSYDLESILGKEKTVKRVRKAKALIIDEISMLDARVLDMVDRIIRNIRQSELPFGGLQIVVVGDFFQLPPVTRAGEVMSYAFMGQAWRSANFITCYLTEQYRQDDELLLSLLNSIRRNEIEEEHYTLLSEQTEIDYENIEPTRLYTHNADVDLVNKKKLDELSGEMRVFKMSGKGSRPIVEGLIRSCLSPEVLGLKEEALVMFTKNNFETGYVNGTLGRVINFDSSDGYPLVKTATGKTIKVEPQNWEMVEDGKIRAAITQLPLRLAWAITIHKSQGMSLDAAEVDLSKAFVYGQGYVALSRVRTLSGLKVLGIGPNALMVDPRIVNVDKRFREDSESARETFTEMSEEDLAKLHSNFVIAGGGSWPVRLKGSLGEASRLKVESTTLETKRLLTLGKTIKEIASERRLNDSTIWTHLEKLIEQKEITEADLKPVISSYIGWDEKYKEIKGAILKVGTEKLKPIFIETAEKFDYDEIRLARMLFLISNVESS